MFYMPANFEHEMTFVKNVAKKIDGLGRCMMMVQWSQFFSFFEVVKVGSGSLLKN